jgi:uncharacterized protein
MAAQQGKFVWYELHTTDVKGAQEFYTEVIGWTAKDAGVPGMAYTIFNAGENGAAGMMAQPQMSRDQGAPPSWLGYISVGDVDADAAEVGENGGAVYVPPSDIPGIGRFSVVADPGGAVFALFAPQGGMDPPPIPPGAIGHGGWRELYAAELEPAFAFYSKLFGWTKESIFDMGPMGPYQLFAINGEQSGGMMKKPPTFPQPAWAYYFNVAGVKSAAERIKAAGGQVVNGPMEVPGGSWIVQGIDPQGAMFALVSREP